MAATVVRAGGGGTGGEDAATATSRATGPAAKTVQTPARTSDTRRADRRAKEGAGEASCNGREDGGASGAGLEEL
ncbi:hypothetical protein AB0393_34645 [Streptomyces cyaneofuscatus]|uniref:hypothetical protein n=1 Tax=Streptomyces cyaneofuscatus TaxID=66883 RepID=UPI00344B5718